MEPRNATSDFVVSETSYFPHGNILLVVITSVAILIGFGYIKIARYFRSRNAEAENLLSTILASTTIHGSAKENARRVRARIRRRSSLSYALFATTNKQLRRELRIKKDAGALIARSNPSQKIRGELKMDSLVGWCTLYFDIPATILIPMQMRGVWPDAMRIPFHTAGTVFYFSSALSYIWLRELVVYASLFTLFIIWVLEAVVDMKENHGIGGGNLNRLLKIIERLYYGAAYTLVIYQCFSLVGEYMSCEIGNVDFSSRACIFKTRNETTVFEETTISSTRVVLCIFTAILSFRGSIQYTLYAKNSSSPAFLWYPSYDAVRYSVKTFIAGVCAYVKFNPKVSMPVCICGFASLALLTYRYQPCQGQGRVANNLRTMGFSMGAWISICGLTAVACNANRNIVNTAAVVGSYAVLLGGTAVVALASWRLNDAKAKQLSLPDTPLEKMLESSQTVYVRKVAASAYLHFAENVKSFDEVDARVLETIGGHLGLNATDFSSDAIYVRLRLCAAYLLMSTVMGASVSSSAVSDGPMKYNLRTIKNSIQDAARGSCIPHYFHRFSKMICCSGKVIPRLEMRTFVVQRKERVFSVKDCLEVVVNALAKRGKSITRIDQARIANALVRHYSDHASGKVDGDHCAPRDDPVYLDAVGKAHIYQIAKEVRDLQGSAENILSGLNFLNRLLSRLSLSYEETYPMHAFQSHFFSIDAGEIEIRSDFAHPLVSLFHMILCWERLREMHEKSLQDGYFKDMIRDVRDAVSSNFKNKHVRFQSRTRREGKLR